MCGVQWYQTWYMHTSCTHLEHILRTPWTHLAHILHTYWAHLAHILHTRSVQSFYWTPFFVLVANLLVLIELVWFYDEISAPALQHQIGCSWPIASVSDRCKGDHPLHILHILQSLKRSEWKADFVRGSSLPIPRRFSPYCWRRRAENYNELPRTPRDKDEVAGDAEQARSVKRHRQRFRIRYRTGLFRCMGSL